MDPCDTHRGQLPAVALHCRSPPIDKREYSSACLGDMLLLLKIG